MADIRGIDKLDNTTINTKTKNYTTFSEIYYKHEDVCHICKKLFKNSKGIICGTCHNLVCDNCKAGTIIKSDKLCRECSIKFSNLSENKITIGIKSSKCFLM